MTKTVSEYGLQFVAQREACVLTTYWDEGKFAIGFGDNDPKLKFGDTITMEQAIERFVRKSRGYVRMTNSLFPDLELEQNHFDAMYSMVYNYGARGLDETTEVPRMVRQLYEIKGDPSRVVAYDDMLKIVGNEIARQKTNVKRRLKEAAMFVIDDYGNLAQLLLWRGDPVTTSAEDVPMPQFLKAEKQ